MICKGCEQSRMKTASGLCMICSSGNHGGHEVKEQRADIRAIGTGTISKSKTGSVKGDGQWTNWV